MSFGLTCPEIPHPERMPWQRNAVGCQKVRDLGHVVAHSLRDLAKVLARVGVFGLRWNY
jgi:hypothetical protein